MFIYLATLKYCRLILKEPENVSSSISDYVVKLFIFLRKVKKHRKGVFKTYSILGFKMIEIRRDDGKGTLEIPSSLMLYFDKFKIGVKALCHVIRYNV